MQSPRNGAQPLEFNSKSVIDISSDFEVRQEELLSKQNVVGVGFGTKVQGGQDTGQPCMKVLVAQKLSNDMLSPQDRVEKEYGNTITDVEEVGEIFAADIIETRRPPDPRLEARRGAAAAFPEIQIAPRGVDLLEHVGLRRDGVRTAEELEAGIQLLRTRVRPAKGGYSVGHYAITAGTIATCVYDAGAFPGIPPRYYILSNNHVLANSNNARVGDPILQPGPYDGGAYPADAIAHLSRWVPIRFGGQDNLVDAAVAEGSFDWLDRDVYWIGYVQGIRNNWPAVGEILQKTGRTTNYTTGVTTAINATINVNYGGGQVARFAHQIVVRNMSAPGDSGSLVLDMERKAIGLLFAGSSTHTILNHIYYVQALLGIRVV